MRSHRQVLTIVGLGMWSSVLVVAAAPVHAQEPTCTYSLTAPRLTTVPGGADLVTATLEATHCTGGWQPSVANVCISSDAGGGTCAVSYGFDRAEVLVAPTTGASKYTATGKGCVWSVSGSLCVSSGPASAILG